MNIKVDDLNNRIDKKANKIDQLNNYIVHLEEECKKNQELNDRIKKFELEMLASEIAI